MAGQSQDSSEGKKRPAGHVMLPEWLLQSNALRGAGPARESLPTLSKGIEVADPGPSEADLLRHINRELKVGTFNILIVGRSGAGKSTLINKIFEEDFATTGSSEPVTMETRKYVKKGVPFTLYDTRGLELKECDQILRELLTFVEENQKQELSERIHVAWLCIAEDGRRVEEAEKELTRRLAQFMPVIAVITKVRADKGFRSAMQSLLPEAKNVVRVRAMEEHLDDGHVMPREGLDDLVEATAQVLPDGEVLRAFASVQKSMKLKEKEARKVVRIAAGLAAGSAWIPVPLANEGSLLLIEAEMLWHISMIFGVKATNPEFWRNLVLGLLAGTGTRIGIRVAVTKVLGNGLKFIPGVGTVVGGSVLTISYAFFIQKLGNWYIAFLVNQIKSSGGKIPSPDLIREGFQEFSNASERQF